jgi:hypothetical protein
MALSSRLRGSKPAEILTTGANRSYPLLNTSKTNERQLSCQYSQYVNCLLWSRKLDVLCGFGSSRFPNVLDGRLKVQREGMLGRREDSHGYI